VRGRKARIRVGHVLPGILILVVLITPASARNEAMGTTLGVGPAADPVPRLSPVSGAVTIARAIRSGALRPVASIPSRGPGGRIDVRASEGGLPVNEDPIVTSPVDARDVMTAGNDYNCRSTEGVFTSSDGGVTFRHHCLPVVGAGGCGDPSVAYDLQGNAFIAAISDCDHRSGSIYIQRSSDNGETWDPIRLAVPPLFPGGLTDKDWLEIDTNRASPYAGAMYLSITQVNRQSMRTVISVSRSIDGGRTWITTPVGPTRTFPEQVQWSDLAIARNGTVFVTWLRCTGRGPLLACAGTRGRLEVSRSTDGGRTWSRPVTIATPRLAPAGPTCFYGCLPNTIEDLSEIPVIAADPRGGPHAGRLYVAFYERRAFLRVMVSTSVDGGRTWGHPVPVAPPGTPGDEFFPWLSVSRKGTVGVSWLDRRDDAANLRYAAYATFSTDGGSTFGPNRRLATRSSDPNDDGFGGFFMGDYTGNAWSRTGHFFAAWMDTRNGRTSQDWVSLDPPR
jgi:hypothetical protein